LVSAVRRQRRSRKSGWFIASGSPLNYGALLMVIVTDLPMVCVVPPSGA
jgi:hypothetical protein